MRGIQKIGAFYSHGPHYLRLLAELRDRYPDAAITAIIPAAYPVETLANAASHVLQYGGTPRSLRGVRALWTLRKQLRAEHFDLFAVMFPSTRLRLLATGAGAPLRYCLSPDGRFFALEGSAWMAAIRSLARRTRGTLTYYYIRHIVRHYPVQRR